MKYPEEDFINKVICGNVLDELRKFPSDCVDTIITSPPYWGLRDYGEDTKTKWQDGWFGQLGLEPTLDLYIEHLLQITAELKRILKPTGVMFWNHGDCYGTHRDWNWSDIPLKKQLANGGKQKGIKGYEKCLMLQNWRLILRMIDEQGWILRNTIIWNKPNAMPSSVKDRFANKYEPVFMLVKNKKYWFDLDAVRVPHTVCGVTDKRPMGVLRQKLYPNSSYNKSNDPHLAQYQLKNKFNYRVRDAEKKSEQCPQFKATKEEIERYKKETGKIKGGGANLNLPWNPLTGGKIYKTSIPEDQAESFGSPRARYWREKKSLEERMKDTANKDTKSSPAYNMKKNLSEIRLGLKPDYQGVGKNPGDVWKIATQPCPRDFRGVHFAMFPEKLVEPMILAGCPKEGIVLDPFCGLGTTCVVAKRLNRNYIGIEISKEYAKLAEKRINNTPTSLF